MSELAVTLVDVGWGDSILVESTDDQGVVRYALVDCNDYEYERSALIFVKRHFHRAGVDFENIQHNFSWVLLTHGHADHARGLKRMMSTFGTERFWYPKSVPSTTYGTLLNYANRSSRVGFHQAIDRSKTFQTTDFGDVSMEVLWPDHNHIDSSNENNNSVVLALTLGQVTFVLTGDAEAGVWPQVSQRIPTTTRVFQAPHHGARNGMFDGGGATPWLDHLGGNASIVMSSHIRPHGHPHADVIASLENPAGPIEHFRTDRHYHVRFRTDGSTVQFQYSHV
jgi:competence protein ComEC